MVQRGISVIFRLSGFFGLFERHVVYGNSVISVIFEGGKRLG